MRAFITGLAGPRLTGDERRFLRDAAPWAIILFRRNIETPDQLRDLIDDCRSTLGRDALVFVDQEGGRVQRLRPPHWPAYPAARAIGDLYRRDPEAGREAAWLSGRLLAADLRAVGMTADCFPVLDIAFPETHEAIGDRAYGTTAEEVGTLGRAAAEGLCAGGVQPVIKHIPGHGRARADSHHSLPVVDTARDVLSSTDFAPFRSLCDLPMAMTAHVVYSAIDPDAPATTSAGMIGGIIREEIGFANLLMSDDVSMGALSGTIGARSRTAIAAGCDIILHCNGDMAEMVEVAEVVPDLAGDAAARAARADAVPEPDATDLVAARARFAALLPG